VAALSESHQPVDWREAMTLVRRTKAPNPSLPIVFHSRWRMKNDPEAHRIQ
jgi:hypothetical protein